MNTYSAVSPYRSTMPRYVTPVTKSPSVEKTADDTKVCAEASSLKEKKSFQSYKVPTLSESLTQQKTMIEQGKNDLISRTIKVGKELPLIEKQLRAFDKQISILDKKISSVKSAEDNANLIKISMKLHEGKLNEKLPFTNGNLQKPLSNLQGKNFDRIISSAKIQMENRVRVLNRQIALDESRFLSGQKSRKRISVDTINTKIDSLKGQLEQNKTVSTTKRATKSENSQQDYITELKSYFQESKVNSYLAMQNIFVGVSSGSRVSTLI